MLLHDIIASGLKDAPAKPAVILDDQSLSYREMDDLSELWARALIDLGIQSGNRISILMTNRIEYMPLYFACYRIGAIACPLSSRQSSADEAAFALNLTSSRLLIVDRSYYNRDIKNAVPSNGMDFFNGGYGRQRLMVANGAHGTR